MEHHSCIHWPSLVGHFESTYDASTAVVIGLYCQTRRGVLALLEAQSSSGLEQANIQHRSIVDQDSKDLSIQTFNSYVESSAIRG